jgi:MFS family permease
MSVESAPPKFKNFYGGFTQLGNPLGALMASGAFWILSGMGDEVLLTWGWRVPFLFSIVLIGVGIWVRYRVEETPVFEEKIEGHTQSTPILFALRNNWLAIILGFCIIAMSSGGYVIATVFVQNFATSPEVGLDASVILGAMTVASFIEALVTLPLALLGDKWGGKRVIMLGSLLSFIAVIPLVLVIQNHQVTLIYIFVSVIRITLSGAWAPLSTVMTQMFRPQARYTSMSLSYGIGAAVWGGLSPAIATGLIAITGTFWSAIWFFGALALIAIVGTWFAPQHSDSAPATGSFNPRLDTTAIKTTRI